MPPELSPWLQYGVLGLVMIALLAGLLVTKGHADEIRVQRAEAMAGWRDQTTATKDLTTVVREQGATITALGLQVAELLRRDTPKGRG